MEGCAVAMHFESAGCLSAWLESEKNVFDGV